MHARAPPHWRGLCSLAQRFVLSCTKPLALVASRIRLKLMPPHSSNRGLSPQPLAGYRSPVLPEFPHSLSLSGPSGRGTHSHGQIAPRVLGLGVVVGGVRANPLVRLDGLTLGVERLQRLPRPMHVSNARRIHRTPCIPPTVPAGKSPTRRARRIEPPLRGRRLARSGADRGQYVPPDGADALAAALARTARAGWRNSTQKDPHWER